MRNQALFFLLLCCSQYAGYVIQNSCKSYSFLLQHHLKERRREKAMLCLVSLQQSFFWLLLHNQPHQTYCPKTLTLVLAHGPECEIWVGLYWAALLPSPRLMHSIVSQLGGLTGTGWSKITSLSCLGLQPCSTSSVISQLTRLGFTRQSQGSIPRKRGLALCGLVSKFPQYHSATFCW